MIKSSILIAAKQIGPCNYKGQAEAAGPELEGKEVAEAVEWAGRCGVDLYRYMNINALRDWHWHVLMQKDINAAFIHILVSYVTCLIPVNNKEEHISKQKKKWGRWKNVPCHAFVLCMPLCVFFSLMISINSS